MLQVNEKLDLVAAEVGDVALQLGDIELKMDAKLDQMMTALLKSMYDACVCIEQWSQAFDYLYVLLNFVVPVPLFGYRYR